MTRPLAVPWLAGALALALAACNSGTTPGGIDPNPSMTVEETAQESDELWSDATATTLAVAGTDSFVALSSVPSLPVALPIGSLAAQPQALAAGLGLLAHADDELPRGTYELTAEQTWDVDQSPTDEHLTARWRFRYDAEGPEHLAELRVLWHDTTVTVTASGKTVEMPETATATLDVDGVLVGQLNIEASYRATSCGVIPEPTRVVIDGYLGSKTSTAGQQGRIEFDELTLLAYDTAAADKVDIDGAIALRSGTLSLTLEPDLTLNGQFLRDEQGCYAEGFDIRAGLVRLGVKTNSKDSIIEFDFAGMETSVGAGRKTELSDGRLVFGRRTAATFHGTFDDEDGDGVWGDNVEMRFKGSTINLEQFLEDRPFDGVATALAEWLGGLFATN